MHGYFSSHATKCLDINKTNEQPIKFEIMNKILEILGFYGVFFIIFKW